MIGGGRRSKYASSYDGKSPEEIRKVKKARKAALEKARRMNQSQQKADEEKAKRSGCVMVISGMTSYRIESSHVM